MASDVGVGDSELVYLDVSPADGTTQVTLTVTPPSGASFSVVMAGGVLQPISGSADSSQRWTSTVPVVYDQPGRWLLHYDVTGTGEGAEDVEVYVVTSPVAGGPTWLPGRSRVANYLPERTLERSSVSTVSSADVYDWTFTSNTTPPGISVDRLIADGAAWVSARIPNLSASLHDAAGVIVALYAAAAVERGSPVDTVSLQRANDLEKRMEALMVDLIAANTSATQQPDLGIAVGSVYCFPPADRRWDDPRYW